MLSFYIFNHFTCFLVIMNFDKQSISTVMESQDLISSLAERLDFINIQILRKFYQTNKSFPNDTQPYCFSVLFMEMKSFHKIKIGQEALRKRLDNLVSMKIVKKIGRTNPANYFPIEERKRLIRAVINRFMENNELI